MYKGIIFDMDGVLADTEGFYSQRREEFLRVMGFVRNENTDFTGSNERAIWEAIVPDDETLRNELMLGYRAYRKFHPVPFEKLANVQVKPLFNELKLRGITTAIASSSDTKAIQALIKAAGIYGLVDFVLSGEECKAHKPDPEIYLRSLDGLKLKPEEALAVEDSYTGILSAKRAGLKVLALERENINQSQADGIIKNLIDVLKFLP